MIITRQSWNTLNMFVKNCISVLKMFDINESFIKLSEFWFKNISFACIFVLFSVIFQNIRTFPKFQSKCYNWRHSATSEIFPTYHLLTSWKKKRIVECCVVSWIQETPCCQSVTFMVDQIWFLTSWNSEENKLYLEYIFHWISNGRI